jgi:hypothetical protein
MKKRFRATIVRDGALERFLALGLHASARPA